MKAILAVFKMRLIAGMQYVAAAWAGISTQFFFGFIFVMIYSAFYENAIVDTISLKELISYLWLNQAFFAIIILWSQDESLLQKISSGDIAYELTKPYDIYKFWFASLTAKRLANVALRFLPVIIISLLLPSPYNLSLPSSILSFILFLLSLGLSLFLVTSISMYIYILTFKTLSPVGSKLAISVFGEFFMGAIIPIPLMPKYLQNILSFFPFRYISDLPFRIYSGNIHGLNAIFLISVQLFWIIFLVITGKFLLDKALKKVTVQGG